MFPFLNQTGMLDSATGEALTAIENIDINSKALESEIQSLRKSALAVAIILANSITENDLDENELPSDRLDSLIAGISNDGDDDEFEADQATIDIVIANVQDALATLGVDDDLIDAMFKGDAEADEAIETASEIIESNLPSGTDLQELFDLFVYGEAEDDEVMMDGVTLGKTTTKSGKFGKVVYKAVKVIRNGKVAVVNKRVSGKVKLSAKQRSALNKARKKAGTSTAIKGRLRSLKIGKKLNI
ncbi:hypothetical protein KTH44_21970 [Acinetobacter bereziniae]|nr:hypothetical protein [Acinetobacter bereziniae]